MARGTAEKKMPVERPKMTDGEIPLRILHVVPTYYPAVRYGGPIYAVHSLCKALAARGHDVQVFTTNVDGPSISDVPLNRPVDMDGVSVRYFGVEVKRFYASRAMHEALRSEMSSFDVGHFHSVFLWPTVAAAIAARRHKVPYLVAPRGSLVPELIRKKSAAAKLVWLHGVDRWALRRAAGLHVTTSAEYADAARLHLPIPRSVVVPNGVDVPDFDSLPAVSRGLAPKLAGAPYILFVGRINWKKGLDRLMSALAGTSLRLLLAGNDEEKYLPKLLAQARELGVERQVEVLGHVDGPDKQWLMRKAQCLVLPSYNENFGNAVVEAMAAGCPVVVTPEVGAAEIVRAAGGGLVVAGEAGALRAALERLCSDAVDRAAMGRAALAYVRGNLSWDSVAQSMYEHYRAM